MWKWFAVLPLMLLSSRFVYAKPTLPPLPANPTYEQKIVAVTEATLTLMRSNYRHDLRPPESYEYMVNVHELVTAPLLLQESNFGSVSDPETRKSILELARQLTQLPQLWQGMDVKPLLIFSEQLERFYLEAEHEEQMWEVSLESGTSKPDFPRLSLEEIRRFSMYSHNVAARAAENTEHIAGYRYVFDFFFRLDQPENTVAALLDFDEANATGYRMERKFKISVVQLFLDLIQESSNDPKAYNSSESPLRKILYRVGSLLFRYEHSVTPTREQLLELKTVCLKLLPLFNDRVFKQERQILKYLYMTAEMQLTNSRVKRCALRVARHFRLSPEFLDSVGRAWAFPLRLKD